MLLVVVVVVVVVAGLRGLLVSRFVVVLCCGCLGVQRGCSSVAGRAVQAVLRCLVCLEQVGFRRGWRRCQGNSCCRPFRLPRL